MGKFQELIVWQRSKDLAVYVYKITENSKFSTDYGLRDQIRRAAVSIPSNIAEGDELDTNKQAIRFLYIAKGSAAELLTQTIIANEIGYLHQETYNHLKTETQAISKMLLRLITARAKSPKPPTTSNHRP